MHAKQRQKLRQFMSRDWAEKGYENDHQNLQLLYHLIA